MTTKLTSIKMNKNLANKNNRKPPFESFTDIMGSLQIIASPLLLGAIPGFIIYAANPNATRLAIAIGLTVLGLIIGIIWARKVSKREGASEFVSKISASPELDEIKKDGSA